MFMWTCSAGEFLGRTFLEKACQFHQFGIRLRGSTENRWG